LVLDIVVRPVPSVEWGVTRWVEAMDQHLGGNAANTCCAAAQLGRPARILARAGRDAFGAFCLARLKECGADTRWVELGEEPTASSVVLVQPGGARTFLHCPGASRVVFAGGFEFTPDLLEGVTHYHLANLFALPNLRPHVARQLRQARELGLATSLDTAWDSRGEWMQLLAPCLPHLDLLFVNEDEARMLTGTDDPPAVAKKFLEEGVGVLVMKLGARGSAVFTPNAEWFAPGFAVNAIDTTGAGDCFAGGFLAALHRGLPLAEAARVANAVGALVVQHAGATTGLRGWQATAALLA
jgi:sugar/nucleoside kinase (ribokinase family)